MVVPMQHCSKPSYAPSIFLLHRSCWRMQTRKRSRAAVLSGTSSSLPALPEAVQLQILDHMLAAYPEPDAVDYTLYPFKSTLGWMLSLRLVNKQWSQHTQQHATVAARSRLESLRNLSLLHVYAHFIVTARTHRVKHRNRKVPKKLTLNFADVDGSSCHFTVPKALNKAERSGGLPQLTLMLVAYYDQMTLPALQQLLVDVDCLDQQHAAPMVLKLLTSRTLPPRAAAATAVAAAATRSHPQCDPLEGGTADAAQISCQAAWGTGSLPQLPAASAAALAAPTPPPAGSNCYSAAAASSVEELIKAVAPLLQQRLVHVVMEGGVSSPALYFIPTKQGFHRRLPAGAAAADAGL